MTKMTISTVVDVDDQTVEDIIVTAFEGGSNYWVDHVTIQHPDGDKPKGEAGSVWAASALNSGGTITVFVQEECDSHDFPPKVVNKDMFMKGLQKWIGDYPNQVTFLRENTGICTLDIGDFDANDADIIFQYAVLGDVIFG